MADAKQLELWKTVATLGGGLIVAGTSVLLASANRPAGHLEAYGLGLLIGGLLLVLLGLTYAFWQQYEWRRPPRLSRGLVCHHYPLHYNPTKFPNHPHAQELAIGVLRRIYPPDFRIVCSAPIRKLEVGLITIPPATPREVCRYHTSIDGVSVHFEPMEPVEPPSVISLVVFSDERIRVCKIRRLNTDYPQMPPSEDPSKTMASEQSPPPSQESSE